MFRMDSGTGARGPIDDFWYKPLSWDPRSGHVSPDTARRLSVVYACNNVLAQTVGYVPLPLYRRRADGGKDRVTDHPAARLMNRAPNQWQTPFEFREMMQGHLGLRGNAYAWKQFAPNGAITALIPLNPDNVTPQRIVGKNALRYVYKDPDNQEHVLRQSEVLHLRFISEDGLIGMNPVEVERTVLSFGLTTQDYGRRFYENDASAGNWIELPGKFENKEAREAFKEAWSVAQTGKNRFRTPVMDNGMKLHEMQLKNTDAQFLETCKYQDTSICRIFRVPPHKIGILDQATFSNIEQQALEFVTDTMMPWFTRWEERLSLELLNEDEQEDLFFEFNVDGLLRGDSTARSNFYQKAIMAGWLTRNEARITENRNPLPGLDEPLEPLNMQQAGADPKDDQAQEPVQPPKKKQKPTGRAALMEAHTAGYLVKREIANARGLYGRDDKAWTQDGISRFYGAHVSLMVKTMAISPEVAAAYAEDSRTALLGALKQESDGAQGAFAALLKSWETTRAAELLERIYADA